MTIIYILVEKLVYMQQSSGFLILNRHNDTVIVQSEGKEYTSRCSSVQTRRWGYIVPCLQALFPLGLTECVNVGES